MTDSRKAILFIGMGDWEVAHLETARELGLRVLAMNRNPDAKTLHHADVPLVMDGKDIEGILEFVLTRPEAEGIIGVYTGTELFLTASVVSAALGLPSISPAAAFAGQHKAVMRRMWEQAGIPTIRGRSVKSLIESEEALKALGLPVIVKPVDSLSARGVRTVAKCGEMSAAIDEALAASTTGTVIIEEFIDGTLHDVNGLLSDGRLYPLGISDKWTGPRPYRVVERLACPTALSPETQEEVYRLLETGARAMGITWGPVKADLILGSTGPVLMELAPRFHGPLGSMYMIPHALGIHPMRAFLQMVTEGKISEIAPRQQSNVCVRAIPGRQGVICSIKGLEEAGCLPGVVEILLAVRQGSVLSSRTSNYDVPGYVVTRGTTFTEAESVAHALFQILHIEVE